MIIGINSLDMRAFFLSIGIFFVCFLFYSPSALADAEYQGSGHIKYNNTQNFYESDDINATLGSRTPNNSNYNIRFNGKIEDGAVSFVSHLELLGIASSTLNARRKALQAFGPQSSSSLLPDDSRRFFDLTAETIDRGDLVSVTRLDRLYFSYAADAVAMRIGRDALSWGNGLSFQVLDLFNPFSPTEIDKDYKTGDDMAYMQYLMPSGNDLQLLAIPRRKVSDRTLQADQSSFAAKYHISRPMSGLDIDLLIARHYDENFLGFGVVKSWLSAVWRSDVLLTELDSNDYKVSWLVNVDRSWTIFDCNVYGYLEYYLNGFGVNHADYQDFPDYTIQRLARGEIFTLAKNYLTVGTRIELNPLLNLYLSDIENLDDYSGFIQTRLVYDLTENLDIMIGSNLPYGPRDTEYGGIRLAPDLFRAAPVQVYSKMDYYF